jgi:hypothetical protein
MALMLSSSTPLFIETYSEAGWAARVDKTLDILASFKKIQGGKIYFDKTEGNVYQSNIFNPDTVNKWIGNWAGSYVNHVGEALYCRAKGLSVNDTIEGILRIKQMVERTLALASRYLHRGEFTKLNSTVAILQQIQKIKSHAHYTHGRLTTIAQSYTPNESGGRRVTSNPLWVIVC